LEWFKLYKSEKIRRHIEHPGIPTNHSKKGQIHYRRSENQLIENIDIVTDAIRHQPSIPPPESSKQINKGMEKAPFFQIPPKQIYLHTYLHASMQVS
jgi:hypothetical protein